MSTMERLVEYVHYEDDQLMVELVPDIDTPLTEVVIERELPGLFDEIADATPKILQALETENAKEQKAAFLADDTIQQPQHQYDNLQAIDYDAVDARLVALGEELQQRSDIPEKHKPAYARYVDYRRDVNDLLRASAVLASDASSEEKAVAEASYTELNEKIYGKVDMHTYHVLLASKLRNLDIDPNDERAKELYEQLRSKLPAEVFEITEEPYKPSDEIIDWVKTATEALYKPLTDHIPEREEKFSGAEIRDLVANIVEQEFSDSETGANAAEGWEVELTNKRKGMSVNASLKKVFVSETMKQDTKGLRALVAHELGVHFLRAVRGYETDVLPLALGMENAVDSEEGLAMVMQQGQEGQYRVAGIDHYITAGLKASGKNFRDTFEVKWRLAALENYQKGADITEADEADVRSKAYGNVRRIERIDGYALNKDLAYYNGAKSIWQLLEHYQGDEMMLNLLLLGKTNALNHAHMQVVLESQERKTSGAPAQEKVH